MTTAAVLTRCALLPIATPFLPTPSSAFHNNTRSSNRDAPSASTISSFSPLPCSIPCLTAPPLPRFFSSCTTRMSARGYPFAIASALSAVPSDDPSSTMRISYVRPFCAVRYVTAVSSIEGSRAVSLYAGMTTVTSIDAMSCNEGRGLGDLGDERER